MAIKCQNSRSSNLKCFEFSSNRFQWLSAFVTSKFIKNINDVFNVSGGYFFFGAMLLLGTTFVVVYAPETKGKTNEQMKAIFMKHARIHEGIINMNWDNVKIHSYK